MVSHKTARLASLLLLAAALSVKVTVLAQLHDHPLLQPHGELDATYYVDLANAIAARGPRGVGEPLFVSPLYVFFLAAIFSAGGGLLAARVAQIVLGTAAVWLIYLTARRWFDETVALVAGALAVLTGLFTFYEVLILQAAIDPFLVALALFFLTRALTEGRWRAFFAAGVALGLLALNRPNALAYSIVAVGLVGLIGWPKPRLTRLSLSRAVVLAGGILLVLLPNAARNYAVSGELIWIASHGGLNFYIGNHEGADGTYSLVPGISPSIAGQARDAKHVAEAAEQRSLSIGAVSRHFYQRAFTWMIDRPFEAARLFGRKVMILLNTTNVPLNYSYAYYAEAEPTLLRLLVVGPWLLLPFGLVGLFFPKGGRTAGTTTVEPPKFQAHMASRSGGITWASANRPAFWIWLSFVPIYGLSVAAFFVSSRYRMPLLVPLCVTTAATLVSLAGWLRERNVRAVVAPVVGIVIIGALCSWNLGLDDGIGGEQTRKAVWLIENGRYGEAREYVDTIARDHRNPGVLRFRVARALAKAGRTGEAIDRFREALAIDHQAAIQLELGQALVTSGRSAEAVSQLTAAFDAGFQPELSGPWLVRALALSGRQEAAVKILRSLPDDLATRRDELAFDLGAMALELQAPDQAERWLRQAVARAPGRADAHEHLGLALLFQGRPQEGIAPLETATRLDPSSASAHLNLAVVYAQVGRVADARREAEASLRLDPKEPRTRQLLDALRAR